MGWGYPLPGRLGSLGERRELSQWGQGPAKKLSKNEFDAF